MKEVEFSDSRTEVCRKLTGIKRELNKSSSIFIVEIRWIRKCVVKVCSLRFNYFKFF